MPVFKTGALNRSATLPLNKINSLAFQATESERLFFSDPPLSASHDLREARQFASVFCCLPAAIDAFLDYARAEAAALVATHCSAVAAVAAALIERRTLNGEEIDQIIASAVARDELERERGRRVQWARTIASARGFEEP